MKFNIDDKNEDIVYLKLVKTEGGDVLLLAKSVNSFSHIFKISQDGTVYFYKNVSERLGFKLNSLGQVREAV